MGNDPGTPHTEYMEALVSGELLPELIPEGTERLYPPLSVELLSRGIEVGLNKLQLGGLFVHHFYRAKGKYVSYHRDPFCVILL